MKSILAKTTIIISSFLTPVFPLMILVGIAIFFDTYAGRWKAKKLGEEILSTKTRDGIISKMLIYQSIILTMYGIDVFMVGDFVLKYSDIPIAFTKVCAVSLIWFEIESIDEKYKQVKQHGIFDALKALIRRGKQIKNEIQDAISDTDGSTN